MNVGANEVLGLVAAYDATGRRLFLPVIAEADGWGLDPEPSRLALVLDRDEAVMTLERVALGLADLAESLATDAAGDPATTRDEASRQLAALLNEVTTVLARLKGDEPDDDDDDDVRWSDPG